MAKIGIKINIDVTKIDKTRLFKGQKGTYLDMTTFIDTDSLDQYGNNGFITQSISKEEREAGQQGMILGNCKVFFGGATQQQPQQPQEPTYNEPPTDFDDDEIPF